jgi:hypothetical protein
MVCNLTGIFERFRGILHEGEIDKRVQFLIEGLFAIRKAKFQVKYFFILWCYHYRYSFWSSGVTYLC